MGKLEPKKTAILDLAWNRKFEINPYYLGGIFCMRLFESAILLTLNSVDHCTMCVLWVWVETSSWRKGGADDGLMDTLHIYSDN